MRLSSLLSGLCFCIFILSFQACSKSGDLGLSLIEESQADILYTDTLMLDMETVLTLPMESMQRARLVVGAMQDPIFGYSESALNMNFRITSTNVDFGNASLDSIVLSMVYDSAGHAGAIRTDPNARQTWQIYRLEESIRNNTIYFSDKEFATGSLLADNIEFSPNFTDSIEINGVLMPPHLRVQLDPSLGQELLNPPAETYTSNNNFKEFFKGIRIQIQDPSSNNSLIRFQQRNRNTKITLYYTETDGNGNSVQREFDLLTDEDSETMLAIKNDYNGTAVLNNAPTDSLLYTQGLNGLSAAIRFPSLENLGNILVNKAELLLYTIEPESDAFPRIKQLVGTSYNPSSGSYELISDVSNSLLRGSSYEISGGTLQQPSGESFYRLNLSLYMQDLLRGRISDNTLYLQTATINTLERVVLANHRHPSKAAILLLTYTRIDN